MSKLLRRVSLEVAGSLRRAYGQLKNRSAKSAFIGNVCMTYSLERKYAIKLPPGHIQVDTVALCGGDMHGNFFWILTLTDKKTQWTEIWPIWNRSAEEVLKAMETLLRRFPFAILSLHYDNGKEFMNAHLVRFVKRHPEISFQRSRPLKKNGNAHVEQKNGSVVRGLPGGIRVDDMGIRGVPERICRNRSAYFNFCKPCIMITKRAKMLSAKGFAKSYDAPRLPAQRALDEHIVSPAEEKFLKRKIASTNGIEAYRFTVRCRQRLKKKLVTPRTLIANPAKQGSPNAANETPIIK